VFSLIVKCEVQEIGFVFMWVEKLKITKFCAIYSDRNA